MNGSQDLELFELVQLNGWLHSFSMDGQVDSTCYEGCHVCGVQADLKREKDDHHDREDIARAQLQSVIVDWLQETYLSPLQAVNTILLTPAAVNYHDGSQVCNAATARGSTRKLAEPEAVPSKLKTQQVPMSSSVQGYASILHLHPGC